MKENLFKYIFFVIIILLLLLSINILYKNKKINENSEQEKNKQFLKISNEINIGLTGYDTMNPILSFNRDIQYIDKLVFDSLLSITNDFKTENSLAKEFSKINSKEYIIRLKDDIYWHDGTNFTAKDVSFTINGLKGNNVNSIYKENVKNISEVQEIDDYTIKILLSEEIPFFEYMLSFPILSSNNYDENTLEAKDKILIGTGKYRIVEVESNEIKLEKTTKNSKGRILTINLILEDSIKSLYNKFSKKEVDYIVTDNIDYEKYLGTMGYNTNICIGREYEYLILNTKNKLLSNPSVRQAINYAIDIKSINFNIYNNKYSNCNFPIDYGSYLFDKEKYEKYDVSKAKNFLIDNGWKYTNKTWRKNGNILSFNLLVDIDNEKRLLAAKEIEKQLEEVGIKINIIQANNNSYKNYVRNNNYDIILTGKKVSLIPDLNSYLGEENLSNYNNEKINDLLRQAEDIEDTSYLKEKYNEIEAIYEEDVPFISLYSNSIFILTNSSLKGNFSCNWYNLYYNIDNWYKIEK